MADSGKQSDPFQAAWEKPEENYALHVDEKNGFMVLPDANPVMDNHVLIISRETTPYQELPPLRQLQMMALANITAEHMGRILKPKRKIGYAVWGNKIKTAHIHLLPRNVPDDGILFFQGKRPWATQDQLKTTRKLLKFSPSLQTEAKKRLGELESKLIG